MDSWRRLRKIAAQAANAGALSAQAALPGPRVIDHLAERGLLERIRRDRDRRKVELQLTAGGRETIESLIPLVVEKLNLALAEFSSAEVQEFLRLLIKLNTTLQSTVEPRMAGSRAGRGSSSALA
jgi:hypothetical protein